VKESSVVIARGPGGSRAQRKDLHRFSFRRDAQAERSKVQWQQKCGPGQGPQASRWAWDWRPGSWPCAASESIRAAAHTF
jgi:hypothetical protein